MAVVFAAINLLDSLRDFVVTKWPEWIGNLSLVLGIANLIVMMLFFSAMIQLAGAAGMIRSPGSWRTTRILFFVIYVIPFGLLWSAALLGANFNVNLGPGALLLVPIFLIPLVHLFVSTSRMRREAELE